jgi:hypothetical protein
MYGTGVTMQSALETTAYISLSAWSGEISRAGGSDLVGPRTCSFPGLCCESHPTQHQTTGWWHDHLMI